MTSPAEGVKRYVTSWYKLDQLYHKFIYHMQKSSHHIIYIYHTSANTSLRIPYGNKEAAQKLGARYAEGGWYAPPGVDLTEFKSKGWL